MATDNRYQQIVPFVIFALALLLLFRLIQPMITILLGSALLAYISFPLYKRMLKRIPHKPVSILLSLLVVVIVILIPFSFLAFEITQQGFYFYKSLSDNIAKGALFGFGCISRESKVCSLVNQAERFSLDRLSMFGVDRQMQNFLPVLEEKVTGVILGLPLLIAQIFIALIISYFILSDWQGMLKKITGLLPVRTKTIRLLIKDFGNIAHTVIYAQLFVALVQGILATVGFYVFGAPFAVILGVVTAFFALVPAAGAAMVWAPVSICMMVGGYLSHDYWALGRGIGLFLYGALLISTIDNILFATIVRAKANVSPVITIVGVIGGASMFGVVGIFVGPILLPLLMVYFETFKERFA